MKCAHKINRTFVYVTAADSAKPHYLRDRFIKIRKQQEEAARLTAEQEAQANVRPIKQGAK